MIKVTKSSMNGYQLQEVLHFHSTPFHSSLGLVDHMGNRSNAAADNGLLHLSSFWASCGSAGRSWLVQSVFDALSPALPLSASAPSSLRGAHVWSLIRCHDRGDKAKQHQFALLNCCWKRLQWSCEHRNLEAAGLVGPALGPRNTMKSSFWWPESCSVSAVRVQFSHPKTGWTGQEVCEASVWLESCCLRCSTVC